MLRGVLYAPAHDETLLADLAACKAQCQQFNQRADQAKSIESAQVLLHRLLGAAALLHRQRHPHLRRRAIA